MELVFGKHGRDLREGLRGCQEKVPLPRSAVRLDTLALVRRRLSPLPLALGLSLIVAVFAAGASRAVVAETFSDAYRITLGGGQAGCSLDGEERNERGELLRAWRETRLRIGRDGAVSEITNRLERRRGREGNADTLWSIASSSGSAPTEVTCVCDLDSLRWSVVTGDARARGAIARPPDFLLLGDERALFARPGPTELTWSEFDSDAIRIVQATGVCDGETLLAPESRPAFAWRLTTSAAPGLLSLEWRDQTGRRIRSSVPAWGLEETLETGDPCASSASVSELFGSVRVDLTSPWIESGPLRHVTYLLQRVDGAPLRAFDEVDGVVCTETPDGLEISIDAADSGRPSPKPTEECRESSRWIESNDPAIHAAAARIHAEQSAPFAIAAALETMVASHIASKDLTVVFASAAETWRARRGDCTEHAVLLAALFRADSVPARVVAGFVPQGNALVWHLWTEAWIQGGWRAFDAALDPGGSVDARYLPIATSCLSGEGAPDLGYALAPFLGTLRARVVRRETVESP